MRQERRHGGRLSSPTTWIALIAGGAIAGAIALAMAPAEAEASSTTATLTLTGLVDSNCDVSAGGSTAHVAPGGTVTVKASLAGLSVNVPGLGQISIDSSKVSSFVDTVTIDGHKHVLKQASDKIVVKNVNGTHNIHWSADKIVVAGGLLGNAITVPLNGNDVNLPAGGKLSWSGQIVASKGTDCGVQIQTPKVKVSAPGHTISLPGVKASLPNPVHSITKGLPKPSLPNLPGGSSSAPGGKKSSGAPGPSVSYTPPSVTVPQKVMSKAPQHAGGGGGGGGGFVPPNSGGGGGGGFVPPNSGGGGGGGAAPVATSVTRTVAPKPLPSPAAKIKSGKSHSVAEPAHLGGAQLPVLLAILAILALSSVTATYARMHLLRRHN